MTAPIIRLVNTEARMITLPAMPGGRDKPKMLIPGGNNIPLSYFTWLRDDAPLGARKAVETWLTLGILEIDSSPGATLKPEGPKPPNTINDLGELAALTYVECENEALVLMQWNKSETRPTVKAALTAKIGALAALASGGLLTPSEA